MIIQREDVCEIETEGVRIRGPYDQMLKIRSTLFGEHPIYLIKQSKMNTDATHDNAEPAARPDGNGKVSRRRRPATSGSLPFWARIAAFFKKAKRRRPPDRPRHVLPPGRRHDRE